MERGQASLEYVAVVALVALVLGGALALTPTGIPEALARHARVALCIVGGDICRAGDAAAQGLEPCLTWAREASQRDTASLGVISFGRHAGFAIERFSDDRYRVSFSDGHHGGVGLDAGFRLGPNAVATAGGGAEVGWTPGAAYEVRGRAALERLLRGVRRKPGELGWDLVRKRARPIETFTSASAGGALKAGATVGALDQSVLSAGGRATLGRRRRADGETTWYFDASSDATALFGGLIPEVQVSRPRAWSLEAGEQRLRFRSGDIVATLPLTTPANRALARDLLLHPTAENGRRLLAAGTVERFRYRVEPRPSGHDLAVKLGIAGIEVGAEASERTLVAAEVLRAGGTSRRADCLGL